MARTLGRHPCFFKVLIGDFANELRIPPAFVKKLGRVTFNFKNAVLKTDTGKSWTVSMKLQEDSHYYFLNGWKKFVEDQHLEIGDFLVFSFLGDSTFRVVAYGPSGCEKGENDVVFAAKTISLAKVKIERQLEEKKDNEAAGCGKTKRPHFVKTLKKYNDYVMVVPRGFAAETGMRWKKSTSLRDAEGRLWGVKLCVRKTGKIEMSTGWSEFVKANKLSDGDTCSFQCMDATHHEIEVEIVGRGHR